MSFKLITNIGIFAARGKCTNCRLFIGSFLSEDGNCEMEMMISFEMVRGQEEVRNTIGGMACPNCQPKIEVEKIRIPHFKGEYKADHALAIAIRGDVCKMRSTCSLKTSNCEPKTCPKVLPYNFTGGDDQTDGKPKKVLRELSLIAIPYQRKPTPEKWWLKEGDHGKSCTK
jgi:hypothetical protein